MIFPMYGAIFSSGGGDGGSGGAGAHRYWRVFAEESFNNTYLSIAEITMAETVSGADETSTAYAISGGDRGGSFVTANAFDNDGATSWGILMSASASNLWIGQDFGSGNEKEIVELSMTARNDYTAGHHNSYHMPAKWSLQYSDDGTAWTTKWTYVREAPWISGETRTYTADEGAAPAGAFRYWRYIFGDTNAASYGSVAEIEMATTAAGTNDCTIGQTIFGAARGSFPATNAYDGVVSGNNSWSVDFSTMDQEDLWNGQDFGSDYDLYEIRLTARADAFNSHMPVSFAVQCSSDGTTWDTVWNETGLTPWASSEERTFVRP